MYKDILNNLPESVIAADFRSKKILHTNSCFDDLSGFSETELKKKKIHNIFPDSQKNKLDKFLSKLGRNDDAKSSGLSLLHADGKTRIPVVVKAVKHKAGSKNIIQMLIIKKEAKKKKPVKKSAEKKIGFPEEDNALCKYLAQNMPDIIFAFDVKGKCYFVSPSFNRVLGFKPDSFKGSSIFDLVHSADKNPIKLNRDKIFKQLDKIQVTYRQHHADGGYVWFETSITPLKNSKGRLENILAVARDITDRKKDMDALERYMEEMHVNRDIIEQNARELALLNAQLLESETKLKELNASKDKFFSIIAHDLRGPFTGLLGVAEFLHEDVDAFSGEEIKKFAESINKSARAVFNLLENLLQWSRVQTGRIEFAPAQFNLNELIVQVVEIFRYNALKKDITIEHTLKMQYDVFADRNMIDTVLRNLISNAIKFTQRGGSVKIAAEKTDHSIMVSVSDTGVGMSGDLINQLFRIDSHVQSPGTEEEKGTGLGLILCREFVEINGGSIEVDSVIGEGSIFKFTIPLQ